MSSDPPLFGSATGGLYGADSYVPQDWPQLSQLMLGYYASLALMILALFLFRFVNGKRLGRVLRMAPEKREAFAEAFIQRPAFKERYDHLDSGQYVDALYANAGVKPTQEERAVLIIGMLTGRESRATVLLKVAENRAVFDREFNPAFVLMQYFGYLQRDPDAAGYNFWLGKLNAFNGDFRAAEMVKAFISSKEYRDRFVQP